MSNHVDVPFSMSKIAVAVKNAMTFWHEFKRMNASEDE